MITAIIIGILVSLLVASGWLAYGVTLRLIHQRDVEKDRYKKALELAHARAQEAINTIGAELQKERENSGQQLALGKQEGKRAVLDWIKKSVDEGTLEVKVIGNPVVAPATPNPNWQPSTLENQSIEEALQQ